MKNKKTFYFDIDGILTLETIGHDYIKRTPNIKGILYCNKLINLGHKVILYSSRYKEDLEVTKKWLEKHNVQYTAIILGKPQYDYIVDDKSLSLNELEVFLFFNRTCFRHRLKNVLKSENHLCYFCGDRISQKSVDCPKCGIMKCPSCGRCLCGLSDKHLELLKFFRIQYCNREDFFNQDEEINFNLKPWDKLSRDMLVNIPKAIMYCKELYRRSVSK